MNTGNEDAVLETPVMTITVVKIGRKQMTLATFRQIARGYSDRFPDAVPLGWVSYRCDLCGLWLLFKAGGNLYREPLNDTSPEYRASLSHLPQLFIAT